MPVMSGSTYGSSEFFCPPLLATMQVKSVGTLTKILVNNPPLALPPPQAMLSFDDQTHIYTRKTTYLHLSTLYWGGGGGGLRSNCALKNNYSSTKWFFGDFLDDFHKCPNYFWPPLSESDYVKEIMFVVYFCTRKGAPVGIILS